MFLVPTIAERIIKLSFIPCYCSIYETDNSFSHNEELGPLQFPEHESVSAVVQYINDVVDVVCM